MADAHPDADHIREVEHETYAAYNRAEQARTQLDKKMYAELRPYGRAAHTRDATGRLAAVTDELGSRRPRAADRRQALEGPRK